MSSGAVEEVKPRAQCACCGSTDPEHLQRECVASDGVAPSAKLIAEMNYAMAPGHHGVSVRLFPEDVRALILERRNMRAEIRTLRNAGCQLLEIVECASQLEVDWSADDSDLEVIEGFERLRDLLRPWRATR